MNPELAEHISMLAAPIYAVLLQQVLSIDGDGVHGPDAEVLDDLRQKALGQAWRLWQDTLATKLS